MMRLLILSAALLAGLVCAPARAGITMPCCENADPTGACPHCGCHASMLAPAGIMGEHSHARGSWMAGLREMRSVDSGLRSGSDPVDSALLAARGFSVAPTRMDMSMRMLEVMYAPGDRVTLMLMPQYVTMTMEMEAVSGASEDGSGHMDHGGDMGDATAHRHRTAGWGDVQLAGIVRLFSSPAVQVTCGLGASAPTGSVSRKHDDGQFVHYGMQPGSGTWDLLPFASIFGSRGEAFFGAQVRGVVRLEETNRSGYRLGDVFEGTAWGGWSLRPWLSASARVAYRTEGKIRGHYNGPHNHSSPPDRQENYGGRRLDAGIGANLRLLDGRYGRTSLGFELLWPVSESVHGIQLGRQRTGHLALVHSF